MTRKDLKNTFYLIAKYWLGELVGFIKIGNNKEEITNLFEDKYMWSTKNNFGVTEESYQLLEINAKELNSGFELVGNINVKD